MKLWLLPWKWSHTCPGVDDSKIAHVGAELSSEEVQVELDADEMVGVTGYQATHACKGLVTPD